MGAQTIVEHGIGRRKLHWAWAGLVLSVWGLCPALAEWPKPPQPNPDDPVDYVKWINQTLGGQVKGNAHDTYLEAFSQLTPREGGIDFGDTYREPWSDNREVSDWLAKNRNALELFRRATATRECYVPLSYPESSRGGRNDAAMINAMLPSISTYRELAKGLLAQGYRAWQDGNHDLLTDNALEGLRCSHHLRGNCPNLIQHLVGVAIAAGSYDALCLSSEQSEDADAFALRILPELCAADPAPQPFSELLMLERLASWDVCQRAFLPRDGNGKHKVNEPFLRTVVNAIPGCPINASSLVGQLRGIGYDNTLRAFNDYYDALDKWAKTPYHAVAGQAERLDSLAGENENPLVRLLAPSLTRVRELNERLTATRRATHLIVHLFAHRAKTGKFPRSLDELNPHDIDGLRTDPFSGKDLVYRKRRWSFKLYSVAGNLQDDGGKHDPKWETDDYVFWPLEK